MNSAGEAQAEAVRNGLEASQHAPGQQQQREGRCSTRPTTEKASTTLKEIAKDIQIAKKGLEEEGVESTWLTVLEELAERVRDASTTRQTPSGGVEERLKAIEESIKAIQKPAGTGQASWAAIAAGSRGDAGSEHATPIARPFIRATLAQAKGMNNQEILKEIKKTIPAAAAIRVLRSGDIDIAVPDEAIRDRAQGIPPTQDLKIHRKDFLVEVPGVPMSIPVAEGRQASNETLANRIREASKSLSPGLQITRITWLYSEKQLSRMRQEGKPRGSLLVGLATEEMRRIAVQGGLVINAQLYDVRLFERSLTKTQCYNCQQWGHTQIACVKKARCARCAGPHQTRDCKEKRVSCANCGKGHSAWQMRQCGSYQRYHEDIQRKRVTLQAQTTRIRAASPKHYQQPLEQGSGWTTISRKRGREDSPRGEVQRRVGRPSNIEQAARDPNQGRISLTARPSQASSTQGGMDIDTTTSDGS
jgi:hypothetical protein